MAARPAVSGSEPMKAPVGKARRIKTTAALASQASKGTGLFLPRSS
jgi:hypothetical protein